MGEHIDALRVVTPPAPVTRIPVNPADVYIEAGYRLEPLVAGLTYPTGLSFGGHGELYISEAGFNYGPVRTEGLGRILCLEADGTITEVAGGFRGPLTGVTWHDGALYAAEGQFPGRIIRLNSDGSRQTLVDGLLSGGDHFTGNIVFSGHCMYFGVGTFTNSAVVGVDNMNWLPGIRAGHDVPCRPLMLRGVNYVSVNPFTIDHPYPTPVCTGAFQPLGTPTRPGQVVGGSLLANGVIYSANCDGSDLRAVADGFRNPYSLGFSPDGRFLAIDQGYDARGSRPIDNAPDVLWDVCAGGWYGWPDFVAGVPANAPQFQPPAKPPVQLVLASPPPLAGHPAMLFEVHSGSVSHDFSTNAKFGHCGQMFVAQLGTAGAGAGVSGKPGHRVIRADLRTGAASVFLANRNPQYGTTGPLRPVCLKFDPAGEALYLLDFGAMESSGAGLIPYAQSGVLWRIRH